MSACAIRYDKLAANYPAFIKLASIRIWLSANESAPYFESGFRSSGWPARIREPSVTPSQNSK